MPFLDNVFSWRFWPRTKTFNPIQTGGPETARGKKDTPPIFAPNFAPMTSISFLHPNISDFWGEYWVALVDVWRGKWMKLWGLGHQRLIASWIRRQSLIRLLLWGWCQSVVGLEQEQGEREEKRSRVGRGGWRTIVLWEPTGPQHCVSSNNMNVDFFTTSTNISPIYSRIVPKFHYVLFCFVVHSLCSYCLSFQFLFTLSLFNSLTVSLISFWLFHQLHSNVLMMNRECSKRKQSWHTIDICKTSKIPGKES